MNSSLAAVIDIGTNSIKLFIAEKINSDIRVIESLKNTVNLGLDTFFREYITQETINRTISILENYNKKLKEYDIKNVKVIATTAVREASNRDIFIDTILRNTGFNIEVLSAGDVVYYINTYLEHKLKDKYPINEKNLIIAELGSGNIDISFMSKGYILFNIGMPIGILRIKNLFNKLTGSFYENFVSIRENIEKEFNYLAREIPRVSFDETILIDETYSSYFFEIVSIKRSKDSLFTLKEEDVYKFEKVVLSDKEESISKKYNIPLDEAAFMPTYSIILSMFKKFCGNKNVYILDVPLSESVLANMLLDLEVVEKYNKKNQLISLAKYICKKFNTDIQHSNQVAYLSNFIFENLKDILGLSEESSLYLLLAAYLHDIGDFINNRSHHKHSEYLVYNQNFFRLNDEEVKIIACISRYHRKGLPSETHPLYNSLPTEKKILVQKLSSILKIANALDSSHKQKIKKIDIKVSNQQKEISIIVFVNGIFIIEKNSFLERKNMLEDISGYKINLKINQI